MIADGIGDHAAVPIGDLVGHDDGIHLRGKFIERRHDGPIDLFALRRPVLDVDPIEFAGWPRGLRQHRLGVGGRHPLGNFEDCLGTDANAGELAQQFESFAINSNQPNKNTARQPANPPSNPPKGK